MVFNGNRIEQNKTELSLMKRTGSTVSDLWTTVDARGLACVYVHGNIANAGYALAY